MKPFATLAFAAQVDGQPPQEPPLTAAEREVRRSYGGWTNFMQSFNLKPWDSDDAEEGKAIIAALAAYDAGSNAKSNAGSNAASNVDAGKDNKTSSK
ncbi:hypothetical protein E4U43_002120 [Claviceps pusilla]|uniref:Uncharacterized protein n=1 Tax=Claviceps pusilla TaxID=123648 RepID=A0A9P7T0R8_9HYPO|nr:hypothetical protein E4U43_002120 [Claviceps pusilla]